jgi:transposase
MGQKRTYKQYTKEYKEEAVALVRKQGYSVPEAAKSLGIASNMLYRWKDHIETQLEGKTLSMDERNELKQLRKEVKNLRMEKEILKKASVSSSLQCNTIIQCISWRSITQIFTRPLIKSLGYFV